MTLPPLINAECIVMACGRVAMACGAAGVYLKLLGNLGPVQEESGAETVHRSEGSCRKQTRELS